jgi:hypothetical protein
MLLLHPLLNKYVWSLEHYVENRTQSEDEVKEKHYLAKVGH